MSRRKQSNPRQIKRSLGDMEAREEEAQATESSLTEQEATAPELQAAGGPRPPSPPSTDTEPPPEPATPTSPGGPKEMEEQEPETRSQEAAAAAASPWSGPDELELVLRDGRRCVQARLSLAEGLSWGPFQGSIQTRASSPPPAEPGPALTLLLVDEACWLRTLPQAPTEAEANAEIHRKDDTLWCRVTKPVPAGGLLHVFLAAEPCGHAVKKEPAEPECPAPVPTDIQLLPQQAGMASILASAVINKDVFPCKDCGIWYRSERNLQAHLLYYCASRQSAGSPATAATEEKPKESYPNERVCPFPQCRKSCPSASSLEIHMRSHSGERPFVCLICLSAFTTKANCERHLKVHTDTLSGVCHSCGFISTTRDILYSHLVTNHMVCQPGSKGEIYSPGAGHPAAKLPPDSLASIQQHSAPHGPRASGDLGLAPAPSPGQDRKVLAEATNGEARVAPQNGDDSETPTAPRSIKVEAVEEPEAARAPGPGEPGAQALSRTPSPHSPAAARVKAELSSPTPGSSPGPGELGLAGALFLPHYVFGPDAGAPSGAPQASEILAKMSELVHSRLQQGAGVAGTPAGLFAGAKGATCFECEITFNNVNNFYVHKRLYCSGRRPPEDTPAARRPKATPGPPRATPGPPAEPEATRSSPGPGTREDEAGGAATPEAEAAGRGSEGSQSPGSSVDDAEDDPSRTLCEACNIRFSRHETYTVHKRYYCASRHDPPPRRPPAPAPTPGTAPPALTAPPVRTRRRRKLYELHAAGPAPPAAGPAPAPAPPGPAPEPPASPRPGSGIAGPAPEPAADGPIDLSKRPRRQPPDAPAALPALADYHECTACRVSFHSLEAYLAHKQYSCPAAPLRPAAPCPYCPPSARARGDLLEHLRLAHGLRVARPEPSALDSPEGRAPRSPSPPAPNADPADLGTTTPSKGPPAPAASSHRYCRLCNIRFSSLSTFIAHKKYYCSSHAAEHVK
uniref:zinc finger protein ZFPM1 n=1 Tax=Callospermophilus lateralis TaxID=76772 RepID=UPI004038FA75